MPSLYNASSGSWRTVSPLALRKEARKSWDYFVSDKVVHLAELPRLNCNITLSIPEQYCRLWFWIELYVRLKGEGHTDFYAVIEHAVGNLRRIRNLNIKSSRVNGNNGVPGDISKLVKEPEWVLGGGISSVIWLKRLDDLAPVLRTDRFLMDHAATTAPVYSRS
jgi:hypothetical protein